MNMSHPRPSPRRGQTTSTLPSANSTNESSRHYSSHQKNYCLVPWSTPLAHRPQPPPQNPPTKISLRRWYTSTSSAWMERAGRPRSLIAYPRHARARPRMSSPPCLSCLFSLALATCSLGVRMDMRSQPRAGPHWYPHPPFLCACTSRVCACMHAFIQ